VTAQPDVLSDALEAAADTAEDAARNQRDSARAARGLARRRRRGLEAADSEFAPQLTQLVAMLASSAHRLTGAVLNVRRGWVRALASDGHSIRQIGRLLGVSHQRVSALARGNNHRSPDRGDV
jgi:DNA-binding NarL/FixJ family response regulator